MVTYRSLSELDDAHGQERTAARMRIERAVDYMSRYRADIEQLKETFYQFAAHEEAADDPGFREELRRVSDTARENIAHTERKVSELEEEYDAMLRDQNEEREGFLTDHHNIDENPAFYR